MKFTDLFIKRPVLAIVINLVVLLAGVQSYFTLNTRQYPKSDIAIVEGKTHYVGASADLVRGFVTTPLERVGARTFAMRIWLRPDRLAALHLTPTDVRNALAANNYLSALGKTKGSMVSINLVANTDLRTSDEFKELVLKQKNEAIIRLEDVAD